VRFAPAWARFVSERTWHPSQRVEARADGSLELALEVAGLSEVKSWVLSFGAGAKVLEPERLRRDVQQELAKALRQYR
jgi:predicted DNA-binding transcriptional regulator YafY